MKVDAKHKVITKYKVEVFGYKWDKTVDIIQHNTCKCCGYDNSVLVSRVLASAIGIAESVKIAKRICELLNKHGFNSKHSTIPNK